MRSGAALLNGAFLIMGCTPAMIFCLGQLMQYTYRLGARRDGKLVISRVHPICVKGLELYS